MAVFAEPIAHVDMDAFFVEVERRRRPELRGRAVVVGGAGVRSVVAAASYEARSRGVHSAMPMGQARRLCPHAVVVPPDHSAYQAASAEVFAVLGEFTPEVEAVSVDEAFLGVSGLHRHFAGPVALGEAIRSEIRQRLDLPCSIGFATTKLLAKMASRRAKPDGLLVVAAGTEKAFLDPLPVRELWGVGEATHARLEELGIATIGDLAGLPAEILERRLGPSLGSHLAALAAGRDDRVVVGAEPARSISVEETYETDLTDPAAIRAELLGQADRLAGRLHAEAVAAGTIQLKVRYPDFTTITRSHTFAEPVWAAQDLYAAAVDLLGRTDAGPVAVRLLGLGAAGLVDLAAPRQLGLEPRPWDEVERAVAEVRDRFGDDALSRARLGSSRRQRRPPPGP
ncbi:MAG TPA: DNA polymerase IV [Acidimicrobiia bacterium]|nr:DNA polymerase IV [Acidimicrobiia bacterium]